MKLNIITLSTLFFATTAVAQDYCISSCSINTFGSNWNYANLRSNPCNNRKAIGRLNDGNVVYNLNQNKFGCGFWYTQVLTSDNRVGWVASQFLDCGGGPPVAAGPTPADNPDALL